MLQDRIVYTNTNSDFDTNTYFYISTDTGLICLKQPLYGPTRTEYRVSENHQHLQEF